jgi:hypothetical protein
MESLPRLRRIEESLLLIDELVMVEELLVLIDEFE